MILLLIPYQVLGLLALLVCAPYALLRFALHPQEMRERWGRGAASPSGERPLWVHAASLGELEALSALLEDARGESLRPFVLTVLSVSSRAQAARRIPTASRISFAPMDLFFAVETFLGRVRPRGLLLFETELWPWTLAACHRRGIPVAVVSGRLSLRRWTGTRMLAPLLRPLMDGIDAIGAQSAGDGDRFRLMGGRSVNITGNLKYRLQTTTAQCVVSVADELDGPDVGGPLVFVAGSVRKGEEGVLLAAGLPGVVLILAPRHLRERTHWLDACRRRGLPVLLRSQSDLRIPVPAALRGAAPAAACRAEVLERLGARVLLVDVHGELASWYVLADAAFVGGTLVPIGGHNLFEPIREGIPVAFGPHSGGVAELAEPLLASGGGTRVADGEALCAWLTRLAGDPALRRKMGSAARGTALEAAGALDRTWRFLEMLRWPQQPPKGASQ